MDKFGNRLKIGENEIDYLGKREKNVKFVFQFLWQMTFKKILYHPSSFKNLHQSQKFRIFK